MDFSPLIISVPDLLRGPVEVQLDEAPSALDLADEGVEFVGRVTGHLTWSWFHGRVMAEGDLLATAKTTCARCLGEAVLRLQARPRLFFSNQPVQPSEGIDVHLDDEEVFAYKDETIDAREAVREILMAEIPLLALCSKDCKGLCANCGADLNAGPCACGAGQTGSGSESGWKGQLDQLRDKL
jgi:uncharacterized protein